MHSDSRPAALNITIEVTTARESGRVIGIPPEEHSLGAEGDRTAANRGENENRLLTDPWDRSIGQEWRHFNPAWLHVRLTANDGEFTRSDDVAVTVTAAAPGYEAGADTVAVEVAQVVLALGEDEALRSAPTTRCFSICCRITTKCSGPLLCWMTGWTP